MASRFRWTLTNTPPPFEGPVTTEVLSKDPIGWEDMTLRLVRDKFYNGVFTEFSLMLKWHCHGGGKEFIDGVIETYDVNGNITVLIEIDCDSSGEYVELYTGKINLASYQTDGEYTICNIERSDLYTKLTSRDQISVNLETTVSIGSQIITAPTPQILPMHSQKIFLQSEMSGDVPFTTADITLEVATSVDIRGFVSHQLHIDNGEAESFNGWNDFNDIALNGPSASATFIPEIFEAIDDDVEYPDTYTYRLHFSGTLYDILTSPQTRSGVHSLVLRYGPDHTLSTAINLWTSGSHSYSDASHSHSFDTGALSGFITLDFGDKVWLEWFIDESISTGPYLDDITFRWDYDTAQFSIEIDSTTPTTACKTMLVHEAFNQVCDAIADEDFRFYSEFYGRTDSQKITYAEEGCGSKIAITNGLNIREFVDKGIFCSLKDLFSSANALHNIGLTIEQVATIYAGTFEAIRVEPIAYFFDTTTQILNLTRPVKVKTTKDNSRYFNRIIIGYDKWEAELRGGLDDPCAKHEYSTKINAINGQYSQLSKYIGSGYAIEFTRRKNSRAERTRDWRYDNDNFFISTKSVFIGVVNFQDGLGIIGAMTITGLSTANVHIGDTLEITGTALNDGTYTVSLVTEPAGGGIQVTMVEPTVFELTATTTIDNLYAPIYSPEIYTDFLTVVLPTGMLQAFTAYNLRLTPARMLQPHMKTISAGLTLIAGQVKFINGEGNTELLTQINGSACPERYNGQPLQENDSLTWNDGDVADVSPLWIPEIYEFEYPISAAQLVAIQADPHGYISVMDDHGNIKDGFILDVDYTLKTGKTKFQLLRKYA